MSDMAAIMATTGKVSTLADGTIRIVCEIPPTHAKDAFSLFGMPGTPVALARITQQAAQADTRREMVESAEKAPTIRGPYGHAYQTLYRKGFFYNRKVAEAVGTDEEYQAWCRLQPSAFSGDFSEFVNGDGRCIYAHCRRIEAGAGVGLKPPYSGIPLTYNEHERQHQYGESELGGREWFEKKAAEYLVRWIKEAIYEEFGVDSLAEIEPKAFVHWCDVNGLRQYLPAEFVQEVA